MTLADQNPESARSVSSPAGAGAADASGELVDEPLGAAGGVGRALAHAERAAPRRCRPGWPAAGGSPGLGCSRRRRRPCGGRGPRRWWSPRRWSSAPRRGRRRPPTPGRGAVSATRSSWRMWPKVNERRNVPSVDGAITRWPSTAAVDAGAQHVGVVDAVATGHHRVHQGQHLAAGPVGAGAVAEVDQLIDQPPRSPAARRAWRAAAARRWRPRGRRRTPTTRLVGTVGGWHRESALLIGTDGRLSNAILPAQRAFLIIGPAPFPLPERCTQAKRGHHSPVDIRNDQDDRHIAETGVSGL